MALTDSFRKQHQEMLSIAGEITEKLTPDQIRKDPNALRTLLSVLTGKLTLHLAMEDKALYPRLLGSKDEALAARAKKFIVEMGGLAQAFTTYSKKWQASSIGSDPDGFSQETKKMFSALANRIDRENSELYPLADNLS